MSEDTPDTHVDNAEPSMEDILASIRRIIADEDVNESVEDTPAVVDAPKESFKILEASQDDAVDDLSESDDDILSLLEGDSDLVDAADLGEQESTDEDLEMLLTELETDNFEEPLELSVLADDESEDIDQPPSGLGAVAAAGLGASASAGAIVADKVTRGRNNPSPGPMDESHSSQDDEDILELLMDVDEPSDKTLVESEPELSNFLKIPDVNESARTEDDDIDALLGDILLDDEGANESHISDETIIDPAAGLLEEDESADAMSDELLSDIFADDDADDVNEMPASTQSPQDLDLVKSLMADLTDDPFDGTDEVVNASSDAENELVDDILSLSMEDEVSLHAEDNSPSDALSQDSVSPDVEAALAADLDETLPNSVPVEDSFVIDMRRDVADNFAPTTPPRTALSDIAQAAQADAQRIERRSSFAATGFAAGAGMMVASATLSEKKSETPPSDDAADVEELAQNNTQEAEDILAAIDPSNETQPASSEENDAKDFISTPVVEAQDTTDIKDITPPQETADMPKAAANKDTIIDEVTEEAAAGAFASLNQVVENQAVMADRGDRIGDLVQEALRPMLKEWLDKNLKGIVERAVTKEVKRISSGK